MLRIRPVMLQDHAEVLKLAGVAGVGMSSLPQDADVLHTKIERSVDSFEGRLAKPMTERFLFVLEDVQNKRLAGTCGVEAHVGLTRPFYSYKLSTIVQASAELEIYSHHHVLHMVNDYTNATEIGSLFLHPDYRHRGGSGKFLSRSRFLMIAEFAELFDDIVISEIRGVHDEEGRSPFYDNLARYFFQMDFKKADYIYATKGGQFIADLMPKYPVYVNLLPVAAQAVIGEPLEASKHAMKFLTNEGFRHQGYIDLFDGGPTIEAERTNIRTVRKSKRAEVKAIREIVSEQMYMIANTRRRDFMAVMGSVVEDTDGVTITPQAAELIGISKGDSVRYAL